MRAFQDRISDWDYRLNAITADGYFKALIRRSRIERPLWAWAIEWNCNYRVIGIMGDEDAVRGFEAEMPQLQFSIARTGPKSYLTARIEAALPENEDRLFAFGDHDEQGLQ